jgi:hypothetical protein
MGKVGIKILCVLSNIRAARVISVETLHAHVDTQIRVRQFLEVYIKELFEKEWVRIKM